jgi:hypothetical protein
MIIDIASELNVVRRQDIPIAHAEKTPAERVVAEQP